MTGCSLGKEQAQQAVQTVQAKYDEIKRDAEEYLPEQAKLVEDAYASVKSTLARGEYMKGLKEARGLTEKVGELRTVLESRKAALKKSWDDIEASVPGSFDELQKRLEALEKSGRLPAGISKEAVASARAALPAARARWDEAVKAAKSADWKVALDRAETARAKLVELMISLGMPVPESWKRSTSETQPSRG